MSLNSDPFDARHRQGVPFRELCDRSGGEKGSMNESRSIPEHRSLLSIIRRGECLSSSTTGAVQPVTNLFLWPMFEAKHRW